MPSTRQAEKARKPSSGPRRRSAYAPAPSRNFVARVFDARPDRLDFRDLVYRPPLRSLPARYPGDDAIARWLPAYVQAGLVLDQGSEGACTGFGLASVVNYLLFVRHTAGGPSGKMRPVSPRMLYEVAKRYDEWPGEDYEGSSCRGALKGWHKHGVCGEDFWPYPFDADGNALFVAPKTGWEADATTRTLGVYYRITRESVVDLQAAIAGIGAVYVSANVHEEWDELLHTRATAAPKNHRSIPDIARPAFRGRTGGHAFALIGYDEKGFIVQNSWGAQWGAGGFARLSYEEWVQCGTDAWTCALGVPALVSEARVRAARWHVPPGWSLDARARQTLTRNNPPDDPWPIDREFITEAYEPIGTAEAYAHTLVTGNDGVLSIRDLTHGGANASERYASDIVVDRPWSWFGDRPKGRASLAIYAHGGLNSEAGSIERVRMLAPYFIANDIYPLFLTWRTGVGETLRSSIQDWAQKIPGASDVLAGGPLDWLAEQKDRALEVTARLFGRGIWTEMRENAARGMKPGHGLDQVARGLTALSAKLAAAGSALDLHLVGHSAGAILLGHLLERMCKPDLLDAAPRIASCTLFAPACSSRFAVNRFFEADQQKLLPLDRLWIYALSDGNEKADGLPGARIDIYGKSLLYLVSRALDDERKMPILGMERALVPGFERRDDRDARKQWAEDELPFVAAWQARWPGNASRRRIVEARTVRTTRRGDHVPATHGAFDNSIECMTETIRRIRRRPLVAELEWLDY